LARFQKPLAAESGIVRLQHVSQLFANRLPIVIVGGLHHFGDGFVMLPSELVMSLAGPLLLLPFQFADRDFDFTDCG
jgi:hypothetical protein